MSEALVPLSPAGRLLTADQFPIRRERFSPHPRRVSITRWIGRSWPPCSITRCDATFERGVTEAGYVAHARRKFHKLWANHASKVGEQALRYFQVLFRIEAGVASASAEERRRLRQRKSRRVAAVLHKWLLAQRQLVPDGSATARAIDYSLKRWKALEGADTLHRA